MNKVVLKRWKEKMIELIREMCAEEEKSKSFEMSKNYLQASYYHLTKIK